MISVFLRRLSPFRRTQAFRQGVFTLDTIFVAVPFGFFQGHFFGFPLLWAPKFLLSRRFFFPLPQEGRSSFNPFLLLDKTFSERNSLPPSGLRSSSKWASLPFEQDFSDRLLHPAQTMSPWPE